VSQLWIVLKSPQQSGRHNRVITKKVARNGRLIKHFEPPPPQTWPTSNHLWKRSRNARVEWLGRRVEWRWGLNIKSITSEPVKWDGAIFFDNNLVPCHESGTRRYSGLFVFYLRLCAVCLLAVKFLHFDVW